MTNNRKLSAFFLGILTVIAVGAVFKIAASVIMPMVIALLLSFILSPVVAAMKKIKIPETASIFIVLLVLVGAVYLVIMLLYKSVTVFTLQIPWYMEQLKEIYKDLSQKVIAKFSVSSADFLLEHDWGRIARSYLISFSNSITTFAKYIFIVFLYLLFLLLEYNVFRAKLIEAYPKLNKRVIIIIGRITRDVSKYLAVKVFVSTITGISVWFILLIIGLDFAVIWGVMAFFFNFIPYIGSILVVTCIVLQSIVQFYPSVGMVLLVGVTVTAVQTIFGSILDPKLQGNRLNLNTVVIVFFLFFWSWLWGPIGILLAIPITVAIKTICLGVSFLKPIGIMMGTDFLKRKRELRKQKKCSKEEVSG
jgi:predicted PurR-regulated permease PerM